MYRDDLIQRRKLYVETLLRVVTRGRWAMTFVEYEDNIYSMWHPKLEINGWAEYKDQMIYTQAKLTREAMHEREYLETCVMQKLIDEIIKSEGGT